MVERHVVWDEDNLRHLLVEHAGRGISVADVEAVISDPQTDIDPQPSGHDFYTGRGVDRRPILVIALSDREVRPRTAIRISESRWKEACEREQAL
jgi:hypothetical protein